MALLLKKNNMIRIRKILPLFIPGTERVPQRKQELPILLQKEYD